MSLFNLSTGKILRGALCESKRVYTNELVADVFPLILNKEGNVDMFCPSPFHGRSVIVNYNKNTHCKKISRS